MSPEDPTARDAARRLEQAGQGHLVRHAEGLEPARRGAFLAEAASVPWEELRAAWAAPATGTPPALRPPQSLSLRRQDSEGGLRRRLARVGDGLLAGGRVATLLLAGGQGTRLGTAGPKGTFVLGPTPDRSLYAIQVERVVAASERSGRTIPLFVLVSRETETATREAFGEAQGFGHPEAAIHFVVQGRLPALDEEGGALLADEGRLAWAPDGHGGSLLALHRVGILDELVAQGVDVLTTWQVDNPLARPLDPVMLGWMVERRLEAVGKAVRRTEGEAVGVYARDVPGRTRIVEYSEFPEGGMPEDLKLGSIALHGFGLRWLRGLLEEHGPGVLPLHRAKKRVPYLGASGQRVEPTEPNAIKLERFLFDVLPHARRAEVHEVVREEEFAPVKNREGPDSPDTARALVEAAVRRRYAAVGRAPPDPLRLLPRDLPPAE